MNDDVWILGATGRTGRAVAARLSRAGASLVLVGRDRDRLNRLAADLGGDARLLATPLTLALTDVAQERPGVVINTVGPFTVTGPQVSRACPPGTSYVDPANELRAIEQLLALDRQAAATGQVLVTGAGFGVVATESLVLRLCAGQAIPARVRVDALASVAIEPGVLGSALAGTIVETLALGGREVRGGQLVRARLGAHPARLTTPDGEVLATASGPSGELLAAWRASGANAVVAASSAAPTNPLVRRVLPAVAGLARIPVVSGYAVNRLAKITLHPKERPRPSSWAHADLEWPSGSRREGWLRAGEAMDFTSAVLTAVTERLLAGRGTAGAHTPGKLFGFELAEAAGAEFVLDGVAGDETAAA